MKVGEILFVFTAFSLARILILQDGGSTEEVIFPTLTIPEFEFIDVSGGCSGFTDCIEYVGAVIYNFTLGIIFMVNFIINLIIYIFDLFALMLEVSFEGVDGAPFWVNILLSSPFLTALAVIIFKMLRKGSSES